MIVYAGHARARAQSIAVYSSSPSAALSSLAKNCTPSFLPSSPTIRQNRSSTLGTISSSVAIRLEVRETLGSEGVMRRLSGSVAFEFEFEGFGVAIVGADEGVASVE